MFTTGTEEYCASSSTTAWGAVRTQMACTKRDSTSAVSRGDSPRESCSSSPRSTTAWPPSSCTPTSKDTRVRVDGCSNTSATLRSCSAREASAVGLQLGGAVEQGAQLGARKLLAGKKVAGQEGSIFGARHLEPVPRPRQAARPRALHLALAAAEGHRALGHPRAGEPPAAERVRRLHRLAGVAGGAAAGGAAAVAGAAGARVAGPRARSALTSRNWLAPRAARGGQAQPRPDRLQRGRVEHGAGALARRHRGGGADDAHAPARAAHDAHGARAAARRRAAGGGVDAPVGARDRAAARASWCARPSAAVRFAGELPLLLGGDLNLRAAEVPEAFEEVRAALRAGRARRRRAPSTICSRAASTWCPRPRRSPAAKRELREPGGLALRLSDHAPVTASFRMR